MSSSFSVENFSLLQKRSDYIRNLCILAHVDHGKTTLADCLVSSNGIISQRMVGNLRYMDSREDEQERGITMKSSAISLHFFDTERKTPFLINLVDSPGHIDFSSEVSTAVRLCDGAIIVVDVVEGVCAQTYAVLRQAWREGIKPVLVLNKIDRLITELKMDSLQAYFHLWQVLEQINAATAELFTQDYLKSVDSTTNGNITDDSKHNDVEKVSQNCGVVTIDKDVSEWYSGLDIDDSHVYFSPECGNVVFGSSLNNYGFRVQDFARIFTEKLGCKATILSRFLWGDFYVNTKTKRFMKGAQAKGKKPLFVSLILDNLFHLYEVCENAESPDHISKVIRITGVKLSNRDISSAINSMQNRRTLIQKICSQWLPLAKACLMMIVEHLPSPKDLNDERIERLMSSGITNFHHLPQESKMLKDYIKHCSTEDDSPTIIFVSKMFPVEKSNFVNNHKKVHSQKNNGQIHDETVECQNKVNENHSACCEDLSFERIAFARVFSGHIAVGQKLFVLGPKHIPSTHKISISSPHISSFIVKDLYILMGRELASTSSVPSGNIVGIGGLADLLIKSGTLASTVMCPSFSALQLNATPIVRVAVETVNPSDMKILAYSLKRLNQLDSCVQTFLQDNGEYVIAAAGEVHLNKCLTDLRNLFLKEAIELHVSEPIVPFRETIVPRRRVDYANEEIIEFTDKKRFANSPEVIEPGLVEMGAGNGAIVLRIKALSLPEKVVEIIHQNTTLLQKVESLENNTLAEKELLNGEFSFGFDGGEGTALPDSYNEHLVTEDTKVQMKFLYSKLSEAFNSNGKHWRGFADGIISFGPRRIGANALVFKNRINTSLNENVHYSHTIWQSYLCDVRTSENNCSSTSHNNDDELSKSIVSNIISGFQLATLCGPLCEEPLTGVCFVVERISIEDINTSFINDNFVEHNVVDNGNFQRISENKIHSLGSLSGILISLMKDCCRRSFQTQPQRLMMAMYKCEIHAAQSVLGKVQGVVGRRRGQILSEDLECEGSTMFRIHATLPVAESFGFAGELRKKASGLAYSQLEFSHYEILDMDPFWVPQTAEEYSLWGDKADSENLPRQYMNQVRKRKGLRIEEQLVEFADKQRTLKKNK